MGGDGTGGGKETKRGDCEGCTPAYPDQKSKMINHVSLFAKPQARFLTEKAYQQKCNVDFSEKNAYQGKTYSQAEVPGSDRKVH